ncbi:methyl-accepting chemotaxis protein [Pontivivens ytuae]|uniref:Methyl-accepting transducer domain-containing protein n=1 Tax=Pontivivens ytuae TaxID=2789856 RepID=A0A7S9LPP0_9RHOB|nr:methyl-accepting chemotaxis protein [Pontivivens ytuae]QPH52811.1 hypothetical protein I0K15_13445 [Pontivivens ytuae]
MRDTTEEDVFHAPMGDRMLRVGLCRGRALLCANIALTAATADSEEERQALRDGYDMQVQEIRASLDELLPEAERDDHTGELRGDIQVIRSVLRRLEDATARSGSLSMSRKTAVALSDAIWHQFSPAISKLINRLGEEEARAASQRLETAGQMRSAVDGIMVEIEQVGLQVRLIALNASVEAARAGGASGRSFGVIAEEIRALADTTNRLARDARQHVDRLDAAMGNARGRSAPDTSSEVA